MWLIATLIFLLMYVFYRVTALEKDFRSYVKLHENPTFNSEYTG
jgi:hypothetical protein